MLFSLIRKEVKEMLNKATLIYIVAVAIIFSFIGNVISDAQKEVTTSITEGSTVIAVQNLDNSAYSSLLIDSIDRGADIVYDGTSYVEARSVLSEKQGVALLTIPEDFGAKISSNEQATLEVLWVMSGAGIADAMPGSVIDTLLSNAKQDLSRQLIAENSSLQPDIVLNPASTDNTTEFQGKTIAGMTPNEVSGLLATRTMVIPIAIMMLIIMGSTSVISSMGMEKENRTLETLLTLPVSRSKIVLSKIVGSAVAGLVMGVIYMAGFYTYFNSFGGASVNMSDLGLELGAVDYGLIGLTVFVTLLAALCTAIILGTFASSYRQAQSLTFPIIGMAMLPMMLTMFMDFETMSPLLKVITFIIPFSHPMMAMKALMLDNYPLVIGGILYSMAFTAAMVAITVRIFTTDRVVIGTMPRTFKLSFLKRS